MQESDSKTTAIDFDLPPDQQEIRVLFVVKYINRFKSVAQFLSRRGWTSEAVDSIPAMIGQMSTLVPHFVILSVNHPNKKILNLPTILSQTFNTHCIMFAEDLNGPARKILQTVKNVETWKNAVSGPSAHRNLIQLINKMNSPTDSESEKKKAVNNGREESIKISGGKNDKDESSIEKLKRLMQEDNESTNTGGVKRENSSTKISGPSDEDGPVVTNRTMPTKDSSYDSGRSNSKSKDSISEGSNSSTGNGGVQSSGTLNDHSDAKSNSGDKSNSTATELNKNSKQTSQNPQSKFTKADNEEQGEVDRLVSEGLGNKKSNRKNPIIEKGADNLTHSKIQKGAPKLKSSSEQEQKSKNSTDLPSEDKASPLNSNESSPEALEGKSRQALHSTNEETGEDTGAVDIGSESASEAQLVDLNEEKYNEEKEKLRESNSKKLVNKEELNSFYKIVEDSFKEVCEKPRPKFYKLVGSSNAININIKANGFAGHLVVSFANNSADDTFIADFRTTLIRYSQEKSIPIEVDHAFDLRLKVVDHIDFSDHASAFCIKGINAQEELTISFFENKESVTLDPVEFEGKYKVPLKLFCVNYAVNFVAYMYLKRNNKFYMYLKEGNTVLQKQLNKLDRAQIEELYVEKKDLEKLKEYLSGVHINNEIFNYLNPVSKKTA